MIRERLNIDPKKATTGKRIPSKTLKLSADDILSTAGPSLLWQVPFLLSKMEGMNTCKGFSKSAEENLLHSCLDLYARTYILVTDGSVGKQIGVFGVFLWFSQSEKIFWSSIFNHLNLCDFWIANLPEYSDCLVSTVVTAIRLANR